MFGYHLKLALHSLQRNVVITALMVAAVGVGIGASMTVYTILWGMSGNPIPQKSSQLFIAQIDVWGPPTQSGTVHAGHKELSSRALRLIPCEEACSFRFAAVCRQKG